MTERSEVHFDTKVNFGCHVGKIGIWSKVFNCWVEFKENVYYDNGIFKGTLKDYRKLINQN